MPVINQQEIWRLRTPIPIKEGHELRRLTERKRTPITVTSMVNSQVYDDDDWHRKTENLRLVLDQNFRALETVTELSSHKSVEMLLETLKTKVV